MINFKNLISSIILIVVCSVSSFAKDLYWVGGTGYWNDASHWSFTSGGAGGIQVPTENDNVFIDALSMAQGEYISIQSNAYCSSLYITENSNATINGSAESHVFISKSLINKGNLEINYSGTIHFVSALQGEIFTASMINSTLTIDKPNSTLTFTTNISTNGDIILKSGNIDFSSQIIDCNTFSTTDYFNGEINIENAVIITNHWHLLNPEETSLRSSGSEIKFKGEINDKTFKKGLEIFSYNKISKAEKAPFTIDYIYSNACGSAGTGWIKAIPVGGTEPFTYWWVLSPGHTGGNSQYIYDCNAGNYQLWIGDNDGTWNNTDMSLAFISAPATPVTLGMSITDESAAGACNGEVDLSVSGGSGTPFTYDWSNGAITEDIASLCADDYAIYVYDADHCAQFDTATVGSPSDPCLGFGISVQNSSDPSCYNTEDGTITVSASNGTAPFSYTWSPSGYTGNGTNTYDDLPGGNYSVTITDNNSCTATVSQSLNTPPTVNCNIVLIDHPDCGGTNGSATATASGGVGGFNYLWDVATGSQATQTANNLSAGSYTVTASDIDGCSATAVATLTEPSGPSLSIDSYTDPNCGQANGSITVAASGGATPYSYDWSPNGFSGEGTDTYSDLPADNYTITVIDANNCSSNISQLITDQSGPSASIDSYTDPSCGQSNGSITISAIGGSAPYSYDWSPNGYTGEGTTMYSNIPQGNYTVTITDINGCTVTTSQSISDTDGPTVSIASYTNPLCPGNADGSINLSVSGGSAPYSYTWSPSGYTGDGTANYSNLPEGSYTVTVSDANSCEGTASQSISDPIALSASIASQADATCVGCCNGAASISGSNGTSPYTYSWPDGSTNQTNNGLCAGTHEVTISDANNCTTTTTVTIGEPEALNASIASFSNPSCNGECDGSATITVNGGSTPYYYEWSNLGSTATVNNLCNGVYTVTVTDFLFTSVTASVTITEPAAIVPTITGDSETCTGSALLSTQNTYITYQWYLDGNPISGANNATYTASASGTYTVETGDGTCTGISVGHALIVHPITEPIISGDNEICSSGGSSNLNLNTTYNTYQWLLNGTNLSGETAASLIANQSGEYTVTVMDGTCQLTSDIFTISSVDPIGITQNPVDATICPGENHTFTVTGTGQIDAYQWLKNNIPIAGATSDTYTISNASTLDDGIYKCELDNICGTETSTAATLSVNQMLITDQPQDYEGCETDTITLSTVATGNNLSYQWQLNGIDIPEEISNELTLEGIFVDDLGQYNCIVSDDCQSQSTDTATVSHDLVNITIQPESQTTCPGINVTYAISATGANLSYQWQKDGTDIPGANNYFYIVYNAQLADTGLYNCIVTNQCFSSSSDTAYLKMENPAILTQPTDEMICSGESITLSVEAQGYTIDYLWKKDGSIVSGGDSNSITINAADISDEGDYICYISTFCTNLVSDTASLELKDININQQPEDLTLCLGNDASFSVSADGYMNSYQWQHNGTDITGENNATLNLENIAQNNQGIYNCSISNECGVIHTNEVQLSLDTLLIFAHPSSVNICEGEDVTFSSGAFSSVSPRNFQWQKNGIDLPGETNYYLTIPNASYSDTAEYTCIVSNLCETDTTNIAILQIDTTYISMQPSNIEVCTNQPFTLSAEGIGPNISYRWLKNNEYIPGANSANYTVNYASEDNAGEYFCEISSNCITMHTDTVSVSISSITIETTSNDIIACQGDTIDFSIAASGNNIAYQWMFNGDSISGETNSSLQLNNISTAKTGIYYCILSNNCDTIISDVMNLNIDTLTITEQPENVQACLGNNAAFSVSASGQDLSYQWLKNGMEINNATNSFYYINNVSQTDTALYSCIVSSLCETDTSQAALLWLDTIGITNQSDIVYACQNDTLSIFVSAVGTNLMYKWKKNGNYIPNATDSIYYINGLYQNNAASYTCEVSNNCGMIESQSIYVNINSLEITNESVNDTACIGDNVEFFVSANGHNNEYQWFYNGDSINNEINDTLNFTAYSSNHGLYHCVVSNECAIDSTDYIQLQIDTINIVSQAESIITCENQPGELQITANGINLTYQWIKDGTIVAGATEPTLSFDSIHFSDTGWYQCAIYSFCDTVLSDSASISIQELLIENITPDTNICEGTNHSIIVNAEGSNLLYQWFLNGDSIQGAVSPELAINQASVSDTGFYYCMITSLCGEGSSDSSHLGVDFLQIIEQPESVSTCVGDSINVSVLADGTDLNFQWYINDSLLIGETNSSFTIDSVSHSDTGYCYCIITNYCDTVATDSAEISIDSLFIINQPESIVACEGTSVFLSILSSVENTEIQWFKNDSLLQDQIYDTLFINNTSADAVGEYYCMVSNSCFSVLSDTIEISLQQLIINQHPQSTYACPGENINLSVSAIGENLEYQWFFNEDTIPNETNDTLVLTAAQSSNSGNYYCVIEDSCKSVVSETALVNIGEAQIISQPESIQACPGDSVALSIEVAGENISYQWMHNGDSIAGASNSSLVLNPLLVDHEGNYTCLITNSCTDTISQTATIDVDALSFIQHPEDAVVCFGTNASFAVIPESNNVNYQWQKNGSDIPGATNSFYSLYSVANSDTGMYRCVISNGCASDTSQQAQLSIDHLTITQQPVDISICEGETFTLTTQASGSNLGYQWYKNSIPINGGMQSSYSVLSASAYNTGYYTCKVSSLCESEYTDTTLVKLSDIEITQHPLDRIACMGDSASFEVIADGENLYYQWMQNYVPINNENNNSIFIPNVSNSQLGDYACIIWNSCGDIISETAELSTTSVQFIQQPEDLIICDGNTAVFAVEAEGINLQYQWLMNGLEMQGETGDFLFVENASQTNQGYYSVEVTDICESYTSEQAQLSIDSLTIFEHPMDTIICAGETLSISCNASGNDLSYQWYKNGNALPGTNSNELILENTSSSNTGDYYCKIQSICMNKNTQQAAINIDELNISVQTTNDINYNCNGQAWASVSGGYPPYTFQWNDPQHQDSSYAANLCTSQYELVVTDTLNCQSSIPVNIGISVSIEEQSSELEALIYPNPVSEGYITVQLSKFKNAVITIQDELGQILISKSAKEQLTQIDVESLAPAIYFVVVSSKNVNATYKLIVN